MADLGSTFALYPDLLPHMPYVNGRRALAEAIARRLETPRGTLIEDPDYGFDLRQFIGSSHNLSVVEYGITQETYKDERVRFARARLAFTAEDRVIRAALRLEDDEGPFDLVLEVNEISVRLLSEHYALET